MKKTPGEALAEELKRQGLSKSGFAKQVKRTFQTVFNWCRDEGFGVEQQAIAAAALRRPSDFFSYPDLVEQREAYRANILREFRDTSLGQTLTQDEWRSLESFRWPEGRAPTVVDCKGLVRIIRGQLTQAEFDASVDDMRGPPEPPSGGAPTAKKLPKRAAPRSTHKHSRK